MWNAPGGYLDFNETLEEGARRECFEETGVAVKEEIKLAAISTNPHSERQNVVCSFYAVKEVNDISEIMFSHEFNESNEVDDIRLVDMREFDANFGYYVDQMAFGHEKMIREIFRKRINCGWVKKLILRWAEKIGNINLKIS
jgi:ADP-ribose pyrophosphatase YjhB (NUDIX family)